MSIARTQATGGTMDPDVLEWSSSFRFDHRLLDEDCRGSLVHVLGLHEAGLLSKSDADQLVAALERLPTLVARGEVRLPEHEEDVHMAVEAWLKRELGEVADKLHTGRSRNDQVVTDLKLWGRRAVARIVAGLDALLVAAHGWKARQGDTVMPCYTHRQVAIPTCARLWIDAALVLPLHRDRALMGFVRDELQECPLGAGAVGGTTLPIDTERNARMLGFRHGPQNPIDAISQRDYALSLVFACSRINLHLARFCADMVELASDGLLELGGAIAGGSSMMPHKRNPDLFELVRGEAALRHGDFAALATTLQGLGTGYHRDLQTDKLVLFRAVDGVCDCLRMIGLSVAHVQLNSDACITALERGDAIATDLCEALVEQGMPFRQAYAVVGQLVAEQRGQGKRLCELDEDTLARLGLGAELLGVLDVKRSARVRAARFERPL